MWKFKGFRIGKFSAGGCEEEERERDCKIARLLRIQTYWWLHILR